MNRADEIRASPGAARRSAALVGVVCLFAAAGAQAGINVWTSHGPEGALVHALAIDPGHHATVYAGTSLGVFRSSDAGQSWTAANSGLTSTNIAALAIDPSTTSTLYAGTDDGAFRSTDGGGIWHSASQGLLPSGVDALAIDPATPATLYAAQGGCGRGGCGGTLFKSSDGGGSWTSVLDGVYVDALAIDPLHPATLYAATYSTGLFKSSDGGGTWRWRDIGGNYYLRALAIDPRAPTTLYVATADGGLFKSIDGGDTWHGASDGLNPPFVLALAIDPVTTTTLYAGGTGGAFKSTDGGTSWHAVSAGLSNTAVLALALDPATPTHAYAGTTLGVFDMEALCGNGRVDIGEECDDGNLIAADSCTAACTRCGDGIVTRPEECDDGNLADGDCCSADCRMLAAVVGGPIANPANGHRYLLLAPAAWNTSEAQAVCFGAHLATIDDAAENDWVYTSFSHYEGAGHGLWIGLSDAVAEGTWVWSSGAPLTYTHWGEGEPNDSGAGEDYAYILEPTEPRAGFWNDGGIDGVGTVVPNGVVELADCGNGRIDPGEQCDDGNLDAADGCTLACTICGNGFLAPPEQCDDDNRVSGDGCDANCTLPRCGNGIVDAGEECDDGNSDPTDGCTNACTTCGNGTTTRPEQCDDDNLVSGDGCDANCTLTACGNGVVTPPEACDDGNLVSGDGCDANCTPSGCGNGVVAGPEQCDDGNRVNGDGCDANCTLPGCGNDIVDAGEECDDGNLVGGDGCDDNCTATRCGNGAVSPPESCDDGNVVNGDGCDSNCTPTACGNGIVTAGEECDDGIGNAGNGCTIACTICGNGVVTPPEVCDDGNLACGDGCTPECQPEVAVIAGPIANPGNSSRYYLLAPATWLAAEGQALCLGGRLAAVNDGAENAWLYDTFSTLGGNAQCLWIGLTRPVAYGAWRWADGAPAAFTHWGAGEPSGEGRYGSIIGPGEPQTSFWRDDDAAGARCSLGPPSGLVEISDCGNGRMDPGEECDDGNRGVDDGCRVNCRLPRCGDGILDPGEQCDDGNASPADGCTAACTICGDRVVTPPEECDDGNPDPADGCTAACTRCGNGVVTPPEGCDDSNLVDTDACGADCRLASVTVGNGTAESCAEPALDAALAGARAVTFACGDDPVTIPLTSVKGITGPTSVDGGGTITLSGGHATQLFRVSQGALTLQHLTIADGSADYGGAVRVEQSAALVLDDCTLRGHLAWSGGAINNSGTASLTNCTLIDGSADSGGAIFNWGTLALARSTLHRNVARLGGAIGNLGLATLEDSTLDRNSTTSEGAGGAIANLADLFGEFGSLSVSGSTLSGNSAYLGGALYNEGVASLARCTVADNEAVEDGAGGAIYSAGLFDPASTELTDCTLTGNSAGYGGALFADWPSTATLTDSTLTGNAARVDGGAVYDSVEATSTLTNCTLAGNSAANDGGAVYVWTAAAAILIDCTLRDNSAGGDGGAIFNDLANRELHTPPGTLILNGSTLSHNSAGSDGHYGGAISNGGVAALANCTLSDNSADRGGAIFNAGGVINAPRLTLTNCTLSGNSAGQFGGDSILNSTVARLANTIIAGSTGKNCDSPFGPITDLGHNLQWPGTDCGATITSADPQLDRQGLRDNGGPTETIAPRPGSPAIDAGDPDRCAAAPVNGVDQRGYVRPGTRSSTCSIGAYEYESPGPPAGCVGDCNGGDTVTIDEIITMVNIALGSANLLRCPSGDANGDAAITVDELVLAIRAALNGCAAVVAAVSSAPATVRR